MQKDYDKNQLKLMLGTDIYEFATNSYNEIGQTIHNINELEKIKSIFMGAIKDYKINDDSHFLNKDVTIFYPLFDRLFFAINSAITNEKGYINNYLSSSAKRNFLNSIGSKLDIFCTRILIAEMHEADLKGELFGDTPEERYKDFNERKLCDDEFLISLIEKYPELAISVYHMINMSIHNLEKMLDRLHKDHSKIVEKFFLGCDFKTIQNLSINLSDSHGGGEIVFKLLLDNKNSVIYKPRSVKTEVVYQKVLREFIPIQNNNSKKLYYRIIDNEEYGWCEFIEHTECVSENEVEKYFVNLGKIMFVNMLLNTNDLHFENLIVNGDSPVLVDVETLMSNDIKKVDYNYAEEIINSDLNQTVLRSGLLPAYVKTDNDTKADYSAISGGQDIEIPYRVPRVENPYRSDMKIIYVRPKMHSENNQVKLNGSIINSQMYSEEICSGFVNAYKYAEQYKQRISNVITNIEEFPTRILFKNTQQYSMLFRTSYHPMVLTKSINRYRLLHAIGKNINFNSEIDKFILQSEVNDLFNGDIPYFYTKTKSKKLFNSHGESIENFFQEDSRDKVLNKIKKLNITDMNFQKLIILLKLKLIGDEDRIKQKKQNQFELGGREKSTKLENSSILNAASQIMNNIVSRAVISKNGLSINWPQAVLGTESDNAWHVKPLGRYLYDGVAGISIFVNAFLSKLKPQEINPDYLRVKMALDSSMFRYTDELFHNERLQNSKNIGAFYGETSIIYTYELLYLFTKNEKYINYAKKHSTFLEKLMINDNISDFLLGSAGAINVILNLYELTKDENYLLLANKLFNHVKKNAKAENIDGTVSWKSDMASAPLAGLSHGASGFMIALAKLYQYDKNPEILSLIRDSLRFENTLYDEGAGNWKDNRVINGVRNYERNINPIAWCHGSSGILLNRVKLLAIDGLGEDEQLKKDISNAITSVVYHGNREENCLCHGRYGNLLILMEAEEFLDEKQKSILDSNKKILIDELENGNWSCGLPSKFENPSLMLGTSGIGYAVLKMLDDKLPNILTLDI